MIPTIQLNVLKVCTATHSGTFEISPVLMNYWALVSTVKRRSALVAKVLVTRDFLRETSPRNKHFWILFLLQNWKKTHQVLRGQDSPFCTLGAGGCMKSLKGTSASFRAEHTSEEEQVIHSTKVGYKAITCAHVLASTAMKNRFSHLELSKLLQ